jgi:hypothetical protein
VGDDGETALAVVDDDGPGVARDVSDNSTMPSLQPFPPPVIGDDKWPSPFTSEQQQSSPEMKKLRTHHPNPNDTITTPAALAFGTTATVCSGVGNNNDTGGAAIATTSLTSLLCCFPMKQ